MPTIQSMEVPKPTNWQDFENIVRDAQAQRWKSSSLQKNGRTGQRQAGVDICGPDDIGRLVGIQCKRYKGPLTIKIIVEETAKAEKFEGKLTTLFVATTTDHDATLQQQVRSLSDERVAQGKFAVSVLFWDEIVAGLLLNPNVLRSHYPQLSITGAQTIDQERLIGVLELGYRCADLWAYVALVYGEFGWISQTDPDKLIADLDVIERRTQQLLSPNDSAPILVALNEVRSGCKAPRSVKSHWDRVELHAKRVSSRVRASSSSLNLAESNMLDLAMQIGYLYHHSDDLPPPNIRSQVDVKLKSILGERSGLSVAKELRKAKKLSSGYQWAMRVYSLVDREIRFNSNIA